MAVVLAVAGVSGFWLVNRLLIERDTARKQAYEGGLYTKQILHERDRIAHERDNYRQIAKDYEAIILQLTVLQAAQGVQ